jgi:3',5'-cyclic AMP phosphodiesterase CpdA
MHRLAAVAVLALVFAACSDEEPGPPVDDGRFRVVFISDTHITGPQYQCCSESEGIDNASIVKTEDRLREVVRRINAIQPRPDLVFMLGDVTHNPYYSTDRAYYDNERTAFQDLRDLLAELEVPYHIVLGNHDYDIGCSQGAYVSREFTAGLFHDILATEPYQVVDHKGWRFVLVNAMLGPTWEPGNPMCDTDLASYGPEQLAWVDTQLSAGLPTTVMSHFTFQYTKTSEDPGGPNPDLITVVERHMADSVVLTLAGHLHRWLDFGDAYPFAHYILGSTRYDTDNFWEVEFDPANRSYRFLDAEKSYRASPCSDSWLYEGTPSYVAEQPAEDGDCG